MHVYSYLKHSMYCYWLDQALLVEKLTTVYKAISTTVIWSDIMVLAITRQFFSYKTFIFDLSIFYYFTCVRYSAQVFRLKQFISILQYHYY